MTAFTVAVVGHRFDDLSLEREVLEPLGAEVVDTVPLPAEEARRVRSAADAILLGSGGRLDAEAIAGLERCRVIVRYGQGFDNIDAAAAATAGIVVAYVPDYCVDEVSDHALALLLALNRRLFAFDAHVRAGAWTTAPGIGMERLSACTLGIVGLGRIGSALARKAKALGVRVLAHDPALADGVDLEPLLEQSDYVSLHAPLEPGSRRLLDAGRIARMRPTAYLINVARGGLVDEQALAAALREGRLAGAALDVLDPEPPAGSPLLSAPNVILTPHVAWLSTQALAQLRVEAAREVARVLGGAPPRCPVPL